MAAHNVIYLRVPEWLHTAIHQAANAEGLSVNAWASNMLKRDVEESRGLPEVAPLAPAVTPGLEVRGLLTGEEVLAPCGVPWPCEGKDKVVDLDGLTYCEVCRIRLT